MIPMIESYITRIEHQLGELRETLVRNKADVQRHKEAREDMLQKFWTRGKQITMLNEATKSHEALQDENRRLKEAQQELQDRLGRLLEYGKTLTESLRQ